MAGVSQKGENKGGSDLERIFEDNEEVQSFVRRLCGYSLTGDTSEQYLFLLYGTGANGKSTFVETFLTLLGDYGNKTAMQTFLEQKHCTLVDQTAVVFSGQP